MKCFLTMAAVIAAAGALLPGAQAQTFTAYNAASNTLPEAQGWTRGEGNKPPAPAVSGGMLHQGPTTGKQFQYWYRQDVPLDFSAGFTLDANLKIVTSDYYSSNGLQRAGFSFFIADAQQRYFAIFIAATGVAVNTVDPETPGQGIPFTAFNTTTAFHTYRLSVADGVGTFFVDGVKFGATPIGAPTQNPPNQVYFGDATIYANNESLLHYVRYTPSSVDLRGDVDNNGAVTLADAVAAARLVSGADARTPTLTGPAPTRTTMGR